MKTTAIEGAGSLDVRDIIARFEELEGLTLDELKEEEDAEAEFLALTSLLEDLKGNGGDEEWRDAWYPVTLIRESDFTDYARELAEDIGAIKRNMEWPCNHIDWDAAANELLTDYTSVEFDGDTYYYR